MTVVGGELSWSGVVLVAGWLFCQRLSIMATDDLEQVLGIAVLDALGAIHLTVKEAAPMMRVNEANLRSMLRGEGKYHLGMVHLLRLPFQFWFWFGPVLFALVAKQRLTSMAEDLGLRKSA